MSCEDRHACAAALSESRDQTRALDDVVERGRGRRCDRVHHSPAGPARDSRTLLLSQPLVTTATSGGPAPGVGPERGLPSAPGAGKSRCKLTREGVLTGERLERGRDLPPPRHAELLAQHIAVRLGCSGRDAETLSDLVVRAPSRDQRNDLELALGQVGLCLVASSHGSARYDRGGAATIGRRGYSGGRRALRRRSSPRGRARWLLRAPPASARRSAAAGRTRRGGAYASSPARPWRS